MDGGRVERRLPIGAEVLGSGGVHFRVWAPQRRRVEVVLEAERGGGVLERAFSLAAEANGYFGAVVAEAGVGARYRLRLDGGEAYPDPASRFQPAGPHGPSEVVDPSSFRWRDGQWTGIVARGQVLYEMHIGTFTREGTWSAAMRELAALADLGVTCIEVMPIAEFPGRFGWGYDGVDLFAPAHTYGTPDDVRRFVDHAHARGIGVILDVVYNHLGPDGNYLKAYSADYFTNRYTTEWGEALNFDGPAAGPVREFFAANTDYWITEFHFDGLRFDATQNIYDRSGEHILAVLARRARDAAGGRSTYLVGENEPQQARLARPPEQGGLGLDALWNDDYHHSAMVALTGRMEAYYGPHLGRPQEFISAVKWGYLYQGQRYEWQDGPRGSPALDLPPTAFIVYLQNHDQVANSAQGERVHSLTSPGRYRAMTALLLLGPQTPMLFQGQEFAASSPFLYFADQKPELAPLVYRGRRKFLSQFPSYALPEVQRIIPDPADPRTFERSKLDLTERERHANVYALHQDLLRLRREDAVFREPRPRGVEGAVLGPEAFVLRFFGDAGEDRLLVVNLGRDLNLIPAPEPLLAPPEGQDWRTMWASDDPRYGGSGCPPIVSEDEGWAIPGEAAVVLGPAPSPEAGRDR